MSAIFSAHKNAHNKLKIFVLQYKELHYSILCLLRIWVPIQCGLIRSYEWIKNEPCHPLDTNRFISINGTVITHACVFTSSHDWSNTANCVETVHKRLPRMQTYKHVTNMLLNFKLIQN